MKESSFPRGIPSPLIGRHNQRAALFILLPPLFHFQCSLSTVPAALKIDSQVLLPYPFYLPRRGAPAWPRNVLFATYKFHIGNKPTGLDEKRYRAREISSRRGSRGGGARRAFDAEDRSMVVPGGLEWSNIRMFRGTGTEN